MTPPKRLISPVFMGASAVYLCILGLNLFRIIQLNHGVFTYVLDDPYIHLSLAENLLQGHYGSNLSELSSPSSSILWPILLAPFQLVSQGMYAPLFINIIASIATLFTIDKIGRFLLPNRLRWVLVLAVIFLGNLVGLTLIGMEHSLQLLCTVWVVYGILAHHERGIIPPVFFLGGMFGALIRYELIGISAVAILYLCLIRHWKSAVVVTLFLLVTMGGFSYFLQSIGLEYLPNSILSKSKVASSGGGIIELISQVAKAMFYPKGRQILCLAGLFCLLPFAKDRWRVHLCALLPIGLHLVGGRYDWYHRYEVYIWVYGLLMLAYLTRPYLSTKLNALSVWRYGGFIGMFLVVTCWPYLQVLYTIPFGANNVYEQQYQIHRFATEFYTRPIAVNDIGYVSYQNENYVLDLWGLGSHRTRNYWVTEDDFLWIDDLSAEYDIDIALIYANVFPTMPDSWIPLARMGLSRGVESVGHPVVTFYARSAESAEDTRPMIQQFGETLPEEIPFKMIE